MATTSQLRSRICVIWFCFGLLELPWIAVNLFVFVWITHESRCQFLVWTMALFAYLVSLFFTLLGYLVGSEIWKKATIPASCSLAWGAINLFHGLIWFYILFNNDRQLTMSAIITPCIQFGFSMSYLYAGWVGLFQLTASNDDTASDDTDPF
ncbi:MAG: hypothetical protein U0798_00920 [Gemmataceae bacterium]